jgi:hypothetical protein
MFDILEGTDIVTILDIHSLTFNYLVREMNILNMKAGNHFFSTTFPHNILCPNNYVDNYLEMLEENHANLNEKRLLHLSDLTENVTSVCRKCFQDSSNLKFN